MNLWSEQELRDFLQMKRDSGDTLDSLICRTIRSALAVIEVDRQRIARIEAESRAKNKRIAELEDFLNETQARIRGVLRTERP